MLKVEIDGLPILLAGKNELRADTTALDFENAPKNSTRA